MDSGKKLAMYDVRGIQNYIYKTAKVQDAIGASAIVETIIIDALQDAVDKEKVTANLSWCNEQGALPYKASDKDVEVLYIGGGNALVSYASEEVCMRINKRMSRFVLDHTYSLQLAISITEKTDNYANDYKSLFSRMIEVKSNMEVSIPFGAFPVVDVEIKTGLPIRYAVDKGAGRKDAVSTETYLKKQKEDDVRELIGKAKQFDSYIEGKGIDSTIAVIHIDGNNMGLRIRELINGIEDYEEAVNQMRQISYRIDHSYKAVFEKVEKKFNEIERYNVLKILTAGDDITYVCKGKYALSTVEYFCDQIGQLTMNGKADGDSINKYGFSVCAGVAYIRSHFPFSIGYEVAERCCDLAKEEAKKRENMLKFTAGGNEYYKIGNWVDFQICKNVHTGDLESTRKREYITRYGEQLLLRPYEFPLLNIPGRKDALNRYENLKNNIAFFKREKKEGNVKVLPHGHAKKLRNLYSLGKEQVNEFAAFLASRDFQMPNGTLEMYTENNQALWYDALELFDCFEMIEDEE